MPWPSRPRQRFTTVSCDSSWHHGGTTPEFFLGLILQLRGLENLVESTRTSTASTPRQACDGRPASLPCPDRSWSYRHESVGLTDASTRGRAPAVATGEA